MYNEIFWTDIDGDQILDPVIVTDLNQDQILDILTMVDINQSPQLDHLISTDTNLDGISQIFSPDSYSSNSDISQLMIGNPLEDMEHWQMQQSPDTCAIACQNYILNDLAEGSGYQFTETDLTQIAAEQGWYTPGGGTPLADTGNILAAHGIPIEKTTGTTLEYLAEKLNQGEKVIVGVDGDEIFERGSNSLQDDGWGDWDNLRGYIPGQDANHAVQVIGIDMSVPDQPVVILNDPGQPQGQGFRVPAEEFVDAWNDSGNFAVTTAIHQTAQIRV